MLKIPRRIARAPIALYRLGLGGLLGRRFVLLEHRGRRSGQIRQVVLETISVDPEVIHVVSGYGEQAQWLRNVRRSEEHTSELQSRFDLVCRLLLETKNIHHNIK